MLDLGLESLAANETVTIEDVFSSKIEMVQAEFEVIDSLRDMYECRKDIQNYMEIMNSLKVHSSQECMAFAADLLGTDVASLEAEAAAPAAGDAKAAPAGKAKRSFWEKAKVVTKATYRKIKMWLKKVWTWIKNTWTAIRTKVSAAWKYTKETPLRIKVWWTQKKLNWIKARIMKKNAGNDNLQQYLDELTDKDSQELKSLQEVEAWQKSAMETIREIEKTLDQASAQGYSALVRVVRGIVNDNGKIARRSGVDTQAPEQAEA
jgi:hypothetical protein